MTSFALLPFVVRLSGYLKKRSLACSCRIEGVETFLLGSGESRCTLIFNGSRWFCLLAAYPHLTTFAWLYLNGYVDGEGDWMSFAKIVDTFGVSRLPLLERLLINSPLSQRTHYDWSAAAYARFLDDPYMQYTCGRLDNGRAMTLEEAQLAKLRHIAEGLKPQAGERHLDSGCGWGGLIRYLTETFGTISHGITISPEQAVFARERVPSELAQFSVTGFEAHLPAEAYDLATVVGMLEHVPIRHHREFFNWLSARLRRGGRVYLQCITATHAPTTDRVRLLNRYVFEHELSRIEDTLSLASAAGFRVVSVEEAHNDYAFTTWEWVERIRARRDEILEHLNGDEWVYRVLLGYLTLASLSLKEERSHLHRVFFVKE